MEYYGIPIELILPSYETLPQFPYVCHYVRYKGKNYLPVLTELKYLQYTDHRIHHFTHDTLRRVKRGFASICHCEGEARSNLNFLYKREAAVSALSK